MVEGLGLIIYNIFDQLGIGLRTQSISEFVSRVGNFLSLGASDPSVGSVISSLFKDTSHKIIVQLVKRRVLFLFRKYLLYAPLSPITSAS